MKKKLISLLLMITLMIMILGGCSKPEEEAEVLLPGSGKTVGLAMPTQNSQRWIDDCENMKVRLEELGYVVQDQFAENDVNRQISQVDKFIEQKVDCLVIASVDSYALTNVLKKAKDADVPVIAYDRLIMDTDAISYYATFDNKGVGTIIANEIVSQAKLEEVKEAGESRTIEFFMGSPDDNNAIMFYDGLMEVLKPYLDDGTLVCKSGKITFNETSIVRWSEDAAAEKCAKLLATHYKNEDLDICASVFDGFAYGCKTALENAGYTEENWPIITGQDADLKACKNIVAGKQTSSVYKDTRVLAEKCVTMVNAVCNGSEPEINDMEQYNNRVITVPAYLCTPIVINADNIEEVIVGGGYYTEEELMN